MNLFYIYNSKHDKYLLALDKQDEDLLEKKLILSTYIDENSPNAQWIVKAKDSSNPDVKYIRSSDDIYIINNESLLIYEGKEAYIMNEMAADSTPWLLLFESIAGRDGDYKIYNQDKAFVLAGYIENSDAGEPTQLAALPTSRVAEVDTWALIPVGDDK